MSKINWNRIKQTSVLNTEFYTNPKKGFDKDWHEKRRALDNLLNEMDLGVHKTHEIKPIKDESGPHIGKLVCVTCNNKFIRWLPKGFKFN